MTFKQYLDIRPFIESQDMIMLVGAYHGLTKEQTYDLELDDFTKLSQKVTDALLSLDKLHPTKHKVKTVGDWAVLCTSSDPTVDIAEHLGFRESDDAIEVLSAVNSFVQASLKSAADTLQSSATKLRVQEALKRLLPKRFTRGAYTDKVSAGIPSGIS